MADEQVPANWYPDATGTIRWWDGRQWTEHTRDPLAATARTDPTVTQTRKTTVRDIDEDEPDKQSRKVWLTATFVGLLAFFLGMGIGGRGEPATPTVAQPTFAADPGTSPDALDQMKKDLEDRSKQLDDREQQLNEREDALSTPTPTPTPTATPTPEPTDASIDDGTSEVGVDVPAGTYSTPGPSDDLLECSYTISTDETGDNVVAEDSSYDSMTVSLTAGQFFESDNCRTWKPS